jgi:hypothetical protein
MNYELSHFPNLRNFAIIDFFREIFLNDEKLNYFKRKTSALLFQSILTMRLRAERYLNPEGGVKMYIKHFC